MPDPEEELAGELPSLTAALAALPDAAEVVDLEGRFLFVNAAFEQLLGWRASEVLGKTPGEVLRGGTRDPAFYDTIWSGLREGRPWSGVLESRRKDGSLIALEISVAPVLGRSGKVTHILAIRRDITERLRAEEAVRESEARWRTVFERNPAVKLLIDPDSGRIVRANEEAAAFYGWTVAELSRMRIQDINTLPDEEVVAEMTAARTEKRRHFRFVHRIRSGEERRVEVFTGPLKFGPRTLLLSIIHDVTAREVAQGALVASEARLRALLADLPVGVALRQGGALTLVNRAFSDLLGRPAEELSGMDPLTLVQAEDRAALGRRLDEAELGRSSDGFARLQLSRLDGRSVPAEVHTIAFDFDGSPSALLVAVDASDRERLEAQLTRAHRMDALGRLAGGLAHDFNNLLFVVLGSSRLLRNEIGEREGCEGMGRHVERVEQAAQRAVDLVKQLLLFSRGGELLAEQLDASAAVRDVVALLGTTLGPAVRIELDLEPSCLTWMARASFEQVVVNLVVNSNDAMPEGGKVAIRTRRVDLDERAAAALVGVRAGFFVELVVTDDGLGMTKDALHLAFEPFFTTKEQMKGTGLGLSVLYGLVHRAGGSVSVESEPGCGATFRVLLPAAPAGPREVQAGPAAGNTPRPSAPPASTTVLVVDDHPAVRSVLERILVDAGYVVVGAGGLEDAMAAVERLEGRVDLLLTEVLMSALSGPALAERVRARSPGVRVVYMSAHRGDALARAPGAELLEKPFSAEQLLERVQAAIAEV